MLEALGFPRTDADKVTLAVHEACTNVIEHCYGGDMTQRIDVTVFVTADDIAIEIRDYGQKQDVAVSRGPARRAPAGIRHAFYAVGYGRCHLSLV